MKLTIWAELAHGGIADYAHDQALALASLGLDVELLCPPAFLHGRNVTYNAKPVLKDLRPRNPSRWRLVRAMRLAMGLLANARVVARSVSARRPDAVLTHYSEYMAPLWAWRMKRLRSAGVRFFSVLHDPVRHHVVGPAWWHRLSVKQGFSFLDAVFVHTKEHVSLPEPIPAMWVPHGVYRFPPARRSRAETRNLLDLPQDAKVLISFGYIRDNKNLDLAIKAVAACPGVYLVVAGAEQEGGHKTAATYQELAKQAGCADRCRWLVRFIETEEVANLLTASDLSLLAYSKSFVSASGALAVTCNYRIPCLISSGSPTMQQMVREYALGIWVEPDDLDSIKEGLDRWLKYGIRPQWEHYEKDHSWSRNAELVAQAVSTPRQTSHLGKTWART